MSRNPQWLVVAALVSSVAACGGNTPVNNPPVDSGTRMDTAMQTDVPSTDNPPPTDQPGTPDTGTAMDTGTAGDTGPGGDTGARDSGRTDTGVDAGPPYDPCAASAVIDLNMRGTTAAGVTRFTGNNTMVGAMAPLRAPCGGTTGHQVAFRYTPRTSARLRISTNSMVTGMNFDTVVWAQTMCSALPTGDAGVAGSLGCNDDSGDAPRTLASTFTTTSAATMGTAIFIVVAGYIPAGTGNVSQGTFELSVAEVATVAVGGACDPAGALNVCATGSLCVTSGAMSTCVADGARGGRCRTAMGTMPCDAGLTCSLSRCQPTIAVGMPCGSTVPGVCATGSSCTGPSGMQRCVADGAAGGRCRTAMGTMPCDAGLICSSTTFGTCGAPIAAGMPCGMPGNTGVCAMGTSCVGPSGMQRCVADGAAGGRCRSGATPCDAMLTCSGSTCRRTVAAGAACDVNDAGQVCATNTTCAPMGAGATCQMNGTAAGTRCREMAPLCNTGLTCAGTDDGGACQRAGTAGMACDPVYNSVSCPMGTACLSTSATAATCTATRAETEPNNSASMPQAAITASTAFSGALGGMADPADCFAVTVPANGTVTAETTVPGHPGCDMNDTVVTLYNSAGAAIASNDDGPRRNLCSYLRAPMLAAGTYALCVRPFASSDTIASYYVAIGVFAP